VSWVAHANDNQGKSFHNLILETFFVLMVCSLSHYYNTIIWHTPLYLWQFACYLHLCGLINWKLHGVFRSSRPGVLRNLRPSVRLLRPPRARPGPCSDSTCTQGLATKLPVIQILPQSSGYPVIYMRTAR
jgi:hypothetical protein